MDRFSEYDQQCSNDSLALVSGSRPIKMSQRFVLGRENVPCVAKVVNRSLKADCTDFKHNCYFAYLITYFDKHGFVRYVLFKDELILKTVAIFVQKAGLMLAFHKIDYSIQYAKLT